MQLPLIQTSSQYTGSNVDSYTGQGKIWEIASRFNGDSVKHRFDRFGNQLTTEKTNKQGEKEIYANFTAEEMQKRQCMKHKTLNVTRRSVEKKDYEPVGLL